MGFFEERECSNFANPRLYGALLGQKCVEIVSRAKFLSFGKVAGNLFVQRVFCFEILDGCSEFFS